MSALTDLFNRLGPILGELEDARDFMDAVYSSNQTVNAQYDDADREQIEALNGNLTADAALLATYAQHLRTAAQTTLIEEMHAITPLMAKDVPNAVRRLAAKLAELTETVEAATVGSGAPDYAGATGTGKLVVSTSDAAATPKDLQNLRAETVTLECVDDSQAGGTKSGGERFRLQGEAAVDNLSRLFPAGSGIDIFVHSAHAGQDAVKGPGGNLGKNSAFHKFTTADQPDSWTIDVGAAGTTILESATGFRGAKSLELKRDSGAVTQKIHQSLPAQLLKPDTVYCTGLWLQDGATPPTGGTLRVSVRRDDETGMANSVLDVALSSLSGSWSFHPLMWRTPKDVPDKPRIIVEVQTTMPIDGESFLVSDLGITEAWQDGAHKGSPYFAVFAGDTDWTIGDVVTVALTRSGGKLLKFLDSVFGLHELPYLLPVDAATPTYADTLVA